MNYAAKVLVLVSVCAWTSVYANDEVAQQVLVSIMHNAVPDSQAAEYIPTEVEKALSVILQKLNENQKVTYKDFDDVKALIKTSQDLFPGPNEPVDHQSALELLCLIINACNSDKYKGLAEYVAYIFPHQLQLLKQATEQSDEQKQETQNLLERVKKFATAHELEHLVQEHGHGNLLARL